MKLICPEHQNALEPRITRYGNRWACPVFACTVACWDGNTSTPADDVTRALRIKCHELFDRTYGRHGLHNGKRFKNRRMAYQWLAKTMGVPGAEAHIGMFTKEQCEKLLRELNQHH